MTPIITRPVKQSYTEAEAASALGVSVDQLRALMRQHIVQADDDAAQLPSATYQPSDLLVLRMILGNSVSTAQA